MNNLIIWSNYLEKLIKSSYRKTITFKIKDYIKIEDRTYEIYLISVDYTNHKNNSYKKYIVVLDSFIIAKKMLKNIDDEKIFEELIDYIQKYDDMLFKGEIIH